ncbi:MAG: hypothetical protein HOI15_04680 [Opitutales bacterium]|nr:hypothetical protein [Opitutales bacterium]
MASLKNNNRSRIVRSLVLVIFGVVLVGFGWLIPSRFKSIPRAILHEAGARSVSIIDLAKMAVEEEEAGLARMYLEAGRISGLDGVEEIETELSKWEGLNPTLSHWGAWDPFLEAALDGVAFADYSDQPGVLGIALSKPCRDALRGLLENSRDPMVRDLLRTRNLTTYKRLFPVQSVSGRPLEATLLTLGLLVQGDRLKPSLKRELRNRFENVLASGDVASLEDFYLDALSLARSFDWGQYEALFGRIEGLNTVKELRYSFHRRADVAPLIYASAMIVDDPAHVMEFLGLFGDDGVEALRVAAGYGVDSVKMLVREQLPLEPDSGSPEVSSLEAYLVGYSLQNPKSSLAIKYLAYFVGAFLAFWGMGGFNRPYRESNPVLLANVQRLFVSLASVIVLVILSEPYLAGNGEIQGYSFKFVMPVLAQVDGETVILETEPTASMEPATLLSVSFFFTLQILVFMICLLKVRQIDRGDYENLIKLKLMENEENLFDSGLYVGIAGTCISLVLQVLGLIEANLIAAYSSNLFGILGVAIVKIQLVRPFKNKLILLSQDELAALSSKVKSA